MGYNPEGDLLAILIYPFFFWQTWAVLFVILVAVVTYNVIYAIPLENERNEYIDQHPEINDKLYFLEDKSDGMNNKIINLLMDKTIKKPSILKKYNNRDKILPLLTGDHTHKVRRCSGGYSRYSIPNCYYVIEIIPEYKSLKSFLTKINNKTVDDAIDALSINKKK